jgi:hypothetical protein
MGEKIMAKFAPFRHAYQGSKWWYGLFVDSKCQPSIPYSPNIGLYLSTYF